MKRNTTPQPKAWPECAQCGAAFVIRRSIVFRLKPVVGSASMEWIWMRDCKHRHAETRVVSMREKTGGTK